MLPEQSCRCFTLAEIKLATYNFHKWLVIGEGAFGKVYRGHSKKIGLVREIAIKRLDSKSSQGSIEFEAEVKVLSKLRHGNLVPLIGYCDEGEEMILAYEFMPNGTLKDHLHKDDGTDLSWLQRLKICIGAARGLDYLHTGTATQHGVIHRDVKTSNILLDANFAAKIADFGLAKVGPINQTETFVSTGVKGTFGYMDPCYFYSGKLTRKSDVYAFGVVLFEVLCGKKAVDPTLDKEQWSLAVWAQDQVKKGKLTQLIDSRLIGQISKKCLKEFVSIAGQCLHNQPKTRPTMSEVVVKLESIISQERKNADSSAGEGGLMNKARFFLTGKPNMITAPAMGRQPEIISNNIQISNRFLEISASNIQISNPFSEISASNTQISNRFGEISASNIQISNPFRKNGVKVYNRSPRIYTCVELKDATNNFKNTEYSGSLDETIFKGWVHEKTYAPAESGDGLEIYVRQAYTGKRKVDFKVKQFIHPNLVNLLGYHESVNNSIYLVYELNQDAGLDNLLFREIGTSPLSWAARLKIAIGAAQGLCFLHRRKRSSYKQFKTAVILVDNDFNARLSNYEVEFFHTLEDPDFFTDRFYASPEWHSVQRMWHCGASEVISSRPDFKLKNEIYAFGVIMLEILTGRNVFDENRPPKMRNLVEWAKPLLKDEANLGMIIDPQLRQEENPPKGAFKFALLVSNCLNFKSDERPCMEEIVKVLYECYEIYG